jgi:hypothetical protein
MPGDDGLGLDDDSCGSPLGPETCEPNPQQPIGGVQAEARTTGALEHQQLVPQGQHFGLQGRSRSNRVSQTHEQGQEERAHGGEAYPPTAVTSTART